MSRGNARESGANAVEFALLVPLVLLLLFAIVQAGWLFSQQLALNNGTREGARFAVTQGNVGKQNCNEIPASVRDALKGTTVVDHNQNRVLDEVTVSARILGAKSPCAGTTRLCEGSFDSVNRTFDSIQVDSSYSFEFPALPRVFPAITMSARAVYRCEFT